jgi:predicted HTH transcriptional regulator
LAGTARRVRNRPFDELTLDDVTQIVADVGEQRETLFFERKARIQPDALAKTSAAFANTMGGLLVVGVADKNDDLKGIDDPPGEPQVWVKLWKKLANRACWHGESV